MKGSIFLVEDDADLRGAIEIALRRYGYQVSVMRDGVQALGTIRAARPDLVVSDFRAEGISGFDLCRLLRSDPHTASLPVILIGSHVEDSDIIAGLELGADDFLSKPFNPEVLVSRTKTVLRRSGGIGGDAANVIAIGELSIDLLRRDIRIAGKGVSLTNTEFEVLKVLLNRRGWVLTRGQLVQAVHGPRHAVTDRAVDVQIAGIREKLGSYGSYIETVRSVGYRFRDEAPVSRADGAALNRKAGNG
jgi:two-component system phosphate regulon response regulator PhoB